MNRILSADSFDTLPKGVGLRLTDHSKAAEALTDQAGVFSPGDLPSSVCDRPTPKGRAGVFWFFASGTGLSVSYH